MFLIHHKPTGGWLPVLKPHHRAGATQLEPTKDRPPRLFMKERHAKTALTLYLRGKLAYIRKVGLDEDHYELECTPDPSRRREDFEVREIAGYYLL